MSTERVSRRRLEQLSAELTKRDRALLAALDSSHLATGNQLLRWLWPEPTEGDARAARRELSRLVEWRVIARLERRLGGLGRGSDSWTYALDTAGQRLLRAEGSPRRPHLPGQPMWRHVLLVTEIRVRLIEALRGTNRSLGEWQGEPGCWRHFFAPTGAPERLKPDGFVRVDGPNWYDIYLLEADTGSQSRTVIRAKLDAYRRYAASGLEQDSHGGTFPKVVFVTVTPARQAVLVDLIAELPADHWPMFAVALITEVGRLLAGSGDGS